MPMLLRLFLIVLALCSSVHAEPGIDVDTKSIRIVLKAEPPNLNSMLTSDNISGFILSHVMEGLLQYNERNELVAGIAEHWQLRADGATFWLRRNARWSDGKPVTAHDFVFAWRQAVNPTTASLYATILFPVQNAQRINRGDIVPEKLGVRAIDDYQLEVIFERPCPYFLGLTAAFTYFPIREDFYRQHGSRYAADANDLLYNGPFQLSRWDHGSHLTLEKNTFYWNAKSIRLNKIDIPFVTGDFASGFNLFQEGSIALAQLGAELLPVAAELDMPIKLFSSATFYFLEFNFNDERATRNLHLRRAIQAILDPQQIVNKVVGLPGITPGMSLFPAVVKGQDRSFREEYPPLVPVRNLHVARTELALAKKELGVKELPPLVLLANTSSLTSKQTAYLQQLLQTGLGIDVRIDLQTFKQAIAKMNDGEFDIAIAGWGADFDDAITFGDLMASWNDNNRGRYASAEYDNWVDIANKSSEQSTRMNAFANMQRLVVEDVPILPLYEHAESYAIDSRLHNVGRLLFGGDIDFRYAYLQDDKKTPAMSNR